MKKRISASILALLLIVTMGLSFLPDLAYAAAGKMIIAYGSSYVSEGDAFTITVTAHDNDGNSVLTEMKIVFDNSKMQYEGSNAESASCSDDTITATGKSITFKFTALTAGSAKIVAYGTTEDGDMTTAGVSLKIHEANESDNTSDETEPSDSTDDQGNEDNSDENTEDNSESEEHANDVAVTFIVNGYSYEVSTDYSAELINLGFTETDVSVSGTMTKGLVYDNYMVLYLVNTADDTDNGYYLYDAETNTICPYLGYSLDQGKGEVSDNDDLQNNYDKLYSKYEKLKSQNRRLLLIMIIAAIVAILIIVNLIIFLGGNGRSKEEKYDNYDEHDAIEKQGQYLEATASNADQFDVDLASEVMGIMETEASPAKEPKKAAKNKKLVASTNDDDDDDFEIMDLDQL